MRNLIKVIFCFSIIFMLGCGNDDDKTILVPEENEALSGGETTVFDVSVNAFGFQAPNLEGDNSLFFFTGNSLFNQNWVTAPASTTARDGLGPFFNARSCSGCHFKDGRGRSPAFDGEISHGLLLRLSTSGFTSSGSANSDPTYGGQLQDQAIQNVKIEGGFLITYNDVLVNYPDGTTVTLRKPSYSIQNLQYNELAKDVKVSPRVANHMIGLGLLEAIPESTLLEIADEQDEDGDGISGRPNYVWDIVSQTKKIGRFGWKANQPNIRQQVAGAFAGDMGITSSLFPDENCPVGLNCDDFTHGGSPEIDDENLDRVSLYSSTLGVPARRNHDNQNILEGKALFEKANCTGCHISKMNTSTHEIAALENQTIRPYTDLLLHDMGDELTDNAPDFEASGSEWRTPPLWGIGLIETVNGHTELLHDGRARNIEEAILWHAGEAVNSKNEFMKMELTDRIKLIDFIKSL